MGSRGVLRTMQGGHLGFHCPGCDEMHVIAVGEGSGPRWGFNGDYERPTFTPSVLVRGVRSPSGGEEMTLEEEAEYDEIAKGGTAAVFASRFGSVCHSFVTDGQIQFLGDCSHALAGQTVSLKPVTE